jgi:NAD(P)-dependent dehydrogenase (short-subunit alcohol dehydrogenase family)
MRHCGETTFGRLDLMVNTPACEGPAPRVLDTTEEQYDLVRNVNLRMRFLRDAARSQAG